MDNNTVDTIMNRRSVREYKNTQVSEKDIETIINAGLYAPSGRNLQTWHFTVVQNRDLIDEIEAAVSVVRGVKDFHPFFGAPTVIFISGDKSSDWMREDCAAATENMMLAAHSIGIGSCWVGCCRSTLMGDEEKWREKLGVPEGFQPMYALPIGYFNDNFIPSKPKARRENTVNFIK